ncbi:hypothetical protein [Novosphingobium mathurense]|uniref:hypothetical protein n=1 Tax=Novosphingobium mathurense TaxID=428990 RepID=UPI001590C55C|nr:hypothetical protein [Novosphingobium mathurense]
MSSHADPGNAGADDQDVEGGAVDAHCILLPPPRFKSREKPEADKKRADPKTGPWKFIWERMPERPVRYADGDDSSQMRKDFPMLHVLQSGLLSDDEMLCKRMESGQKKWAGPKTSP